MRIWSGATGLGVDHTRRRASHLSDGCSILSDGCSSDASRPAESALLKRMPRPRDRSPLFGEIIAMSGGAHLCSCAAGSIACSAVAVSTLMSGFSSTCFEYPLAATWIMARPTFSVVVR